MMVVKPCMVSPPPTSETCLHPNSVFQPQVDTSGTTYSARLVRKQETFPQCFVYAKEWEPIVRLQEYPRPYTQ